MRYRRIARTTVLPFVLVAVPATAQIDTGAIVQGQLSRSMMDGHAERDRGTRAKKGNARAATICTDYLPVYRQQYGDDHPKMQKMKAMCRRLGY